MDAAAALNSAFASGDTAAMIADVLAATNARDILDVGCGRGTLAKSLSQKGFTLTGLDPNEEAVEAAREAAPGATFINASADAIPYQDGSFDACVFLNSLHHVPLSQMAVALKETRRVTRAGGTVLIVEPLPEGPYFEVMRELDDETEVRQGADRAVRQAAEAGLFDLTGEVVYERRERFNDVESLFTRLARVDPTRAEAIEANRNELESRFEALSEEAEDGDGRILVQPLKAYWLRIRA